MAKAKKKVLLCGALGFIGRNFLIHRPTNWQVFSLDLIEDKKFQKLIKNSQFFKINLADEAKVKQLAKKMPKFDICLYLAANGDPALSTADPAWDIKATTLTLINTCRYFKIKKFIYFSSGAVYDGNSGPITPKTPIDPTLPYAISHLAAERYTRFFYKDGEYVVIRFFGAYGPYEPPRKIYSRLVKGFAEEKKKEFIIKGNGQNRIDAMYVEDAISGIVKAIESKKTNMTIDFCKGDHPTINKLVEEAAKTFGIKVKITHEGSVPEYNNFYASPVEFEHLFGFRAKISLEEGLMKLYKHIKIRNSNIEIRNKS